MPQTPNFVKRASMNRDLKQKTGVKANPLMITPPQKVKQTIEEWNSQKYDFGG